MAKYRISFEVDDETRQYFDARIGWGDIRKCFVPIVEDFVAMHKKHGEFFLAAVKSRDISFQDWFKGLKNGDN